MFFKQVRRNSAKSRKGNGLFYGSLIIAIVAFYTLLSLGEQDVMRFLAVIESDAVKKLLALLKLVYLVSLFFLFFLVYFACRYQIDSRRRELGMYQMLGMKRSRMFLMLFAETLWSSLISLLLGIPSALFLTEGISLATAKAVGLGIIGHHFSFSPEAVLGTVLGFVLVQLLSMMFLCIRLGTLEPAELLRTDTSGQAPISGAKSRLYFLLGVILLLLAYVLGVFGMRSLNPLVMLVLITAGILGTFWLYRGLGGFLGQRIKRRSSQALGLDIFTARQVQENVLSQHKSLAVSALLLVLALSCISYGISLGMGRAVSSRSTDFSLFGEEEELDRILAQEEIKSLTKASYPLYLSLIKEDYWPGEAHALDTASLMETLEGIEGSENIRESMHLERVIAESSYNRMLEAMGKEKLHLGENKVALFTAVDRSAEWFYSILTQAVQNGASIGIDGNDYAIDPQLCYDNIVADRAITLYLALVVPDELYAELAREPEPYCRNLHLSDEVIEELGLMQAVLELDNRLSATGIHYDSFLGGIGRNLFYTVASSYLTVYLGVLFLLIANTVIGLKFLIQQRQTKGRYVTLSMLGADIGGMCRSVRKQIQTYFLLVLAVSAVSSAAAIITMFTTFAKLPAGASMAAVAALAAVALVCFLLIEVIYIGVVKRMAAREIHQLKGQGGVFL